MKIKLIHFVMMSAILVCADMHAGLFARTSQRVLSAQSKLVLRNTTKPSIRHFSFKKETKTIAKEMAGEGVSGVCAGLIGTSACLAAGSVLGVEEIGMVGGLVVGPWAALVAGGPVGVGAYITTGLAWVIAKKLDNV